MYLKSLHIQGFKTFEQSTTLELSYPVIAIVGPNGSGKSNLVDALRWTLCEQNLRTLRARSMLDLIFSGSTTRHPVGYAEAEVVLGNDGDVFGTGGETVSIARRIFRSKESDFLVDGRDVQLRDVEELLTSTGLGFRHYPFIGQGEITRIFTMKPEERKALLEEVAGTSEYKQRKRETLVKLEETRLNASRVEDLLTELTGNYAHLEQQAASARKYITCQSRLRELELAVAHARYISVTREQERATARLAEAQEKMAEIIAGLGSRQARYDDLQAGRHKVSATLREKSSALDAAREDAYRLEKELVSMREKAKYLAAEETRLVRQSEDWETSRFQTTKLADDTTASLEQLRREEEQAGAELAAEQTAYDGVVQGVEQRRRALAQAQAAVMQLETEVRQLFGRFNPLQFEQEEKRKVVDGADEGRSTTPTATDSQIRQAREQVTSHEAGLANLRGQYDAVSTEMAILEQEQAALETDSREKADGMESYRMSLRNAEAFITDLERQIRDGTSAVRVLDMVDLGRRKPILLQLCREELSLEISGESASALGEAVRRSRRAVLAAGYGDGPCEAESPDPDLRSVARMTIVRADAPVAVRELLQRLLVMPSLDDGLRYAREHRHQYYKIYCEDGYAIDSALTVSALRHSIERSFAATESTELARREEESAAAARLASEHSMVLAATRDRRQALVAQIQQTEQDLKTAQVRLQAMVVDQERQMAVERERSDRVDAARTRLAEIEHELVPLRGQLSERRGTLARAREAQEGAEKNRQQAESDLLAGKDKVQALQIRHNSVAGRIQALLEKKLAYEDQLAGLTTEIRASQDGLVRVRAEQGTLGERVGLLETQFRDKSNVCAVLQAELDRLELEKRQLDEQMAGVSSDMEGVKASRTRLEGRIRELEVFLAEGKGKLEQFTGRDDFAELASQTDCAESLETLQTEMDEVRHTMTGLEPVNMASIRESEELADRVGQLKIRYDDLTQARVKLLALLDELDERAATLFESTYAVVEKAFQENFVKMFDGGEARLVRQENGELTGIDIDVVLPGKRRQPLELLSGGEKVLAAAAFQFALFKARPSLFYLLDEVDSALDENNVHRFARLLREHEGSQFVVVTHNRETMLAADVLYGVTMEESGVSKVVSLKLDSDIPMPTS